MKHDNVSIALFFTAVAFFFSMSILMGMFFSADELISSKKSNIPVYIFFKTSANINDVQDQLLSLKNDRHVKQADIIDKEKAFHRIVNKFSIDRSIFDYNPFPYSIRVLFKPQFLNKDFLSVMKNSISLNNKVDAVRFPEDILNNIERLHAIFLKFSDFIIFILYLVELVVFISIIRIFYSHKKEDFDTLKFLGVTRLKIFGIFFKNTITPAIIGIIFSFIIIAGMYLVYMKYADVFQIDKHILLMALQKSCAINVLLSFAFALFASVFIFLIKDEKV